MDEFLKSRFKSDLTFIQNAGNYYAQFKYVLDKCATAELENILLFDMGYFSDAEFRNNVSIIHTAKEKAIKTHGEWVIKMFEQSTTRHTPRTFVSSVYSDIFGIVLTP